MANLTETPKWEEGVYQIETSDPVLGGPDGINNRQGKQLANRTSWLKQQTENIQSNMSDVATSGSYNDLSDKPQVMTGASELSDGQQGFVPAPMAGDEKKVLTGDGKWVFMSGMPVGVPFWFAGQTPPTGCLVCDGAAVGRETYPDLFATIGTVFGEGDGSTTFNLPDLIGRHAKGSLNVGEYTAPGLPNITGNFYDVITQNGGGATDVFRLNETGGSAGFTNGGTAKFSNFNFDAKRFNSIYGASDTVDVAAVGFLPCIKAFDAATNPGLIDITELANEMAGKVDRYIDNKPVRYVVDAYSDGTNWYRKWSDGWVEQGGQVTNIAGGVKISLLIPMADNAYSLSATSRETGDNANIICYATTSTNTVLHLNAIMPNMGWSPATIKWEVKGQGAQS